MDPFDEPIAQGMMHDENEPRRLRIQDIESWINENGLRGADDVRETRPHVIDEEAKRFEASEQYQASIHQKLFEEDTTLKQREESKRNRTLSLLRSNGYKMDISTATGRIRDISVHKLASSCDTILAMARSSLLLDADTKKLSLSLNRYSKQSVRAFLDASMDAPQQVEDFSPDTILDCCYIAHYLCNDNLLHEITDILIASIDSTNCFSLCQVADELALSGLFERSLAHMMNSLGKLQADSSVWNDLSPDLHHRISTMITAIESPVNAGSGLFFSSIDEYIAIFAERVQYCKERLAEAKEQQQDRLNQKGTGAWDDANRKIENQEKMVRRLELAFQEQKTLFGSIIAKRI